MQKIGTQYVLRKIKDQVMAPPPEKQPGVPEAQVERPGKDIDGQIINDENGQTIGRAFRLPGVALYVVATGTMPNEDELKRCLADPNPRTFLHTEDGRLTGVIFVPDASHFPKRVVGGRADDV
ncbi:MAG: hypothetical protein ACR2OO_04625 [Thermomicrobiales bacterium]